MRKSPPKAVRLSGASLYNKNQIFFEAYAKTVDIPQKMCYTT